MAKIDEIREQIGLNKFIMGLVSIMIFSITGFATANYENTKSGLLIIIFVVMVVLIYVFIIPFSKTIEKIKSLRDL